MNPKCRSALLPLLLVASSALAQDLPTRISSRWSDSFVEWDIYTETEANPEEVPEGADAEDHAEEELAGSLEMRRMHLDDWTEWRYSFDDESGTIKLKWKDDPSQWELRNGLDIVSMKTAWPNDFSEWRITNNSITLTLRSKYTTQLDEWLIKAGNYGKYSIYTARERDPRDWYIDDALTEEIPRCMRMAILFIAVFHGSPRI